MEQTLVERVRELEHEVAVMKAQCRDADDASELYLKIFEDFPALIWRAGLDMKCNYFNRTWLAFTGRTMEQERGDGWTEGVHQSDLQHCIKTYVENFQARQPFSMDYRLKNRFGEYRWIRDIGRPFFDLADEFLGFIGSCYDVTDERETDRKLRQANRAKDEVFQMIAHDLRGPVSAINRIAQTIQNEAATFTEQELTTSMGRLSAAALNTSKFVNDLLTWSQSQLQGFVSHPQAHSLKAVFRDAVEPLEENLAEKNLSLDESALLGCDVLADREMLKTILRNLVSNALKFSKPGGKIVVAARTQDGFALVTVHDFGVGMPPSLLANLFQLGASTSRAGTQGEPGTGLGLLICRDFAEKNGAKLWAESEPEVGTTFTLQIPLVDDRTS